MNDQTPVRSGSAAPRRRHLMDPSAPPKAPDPQDLERLQRVQRRVMSVLVFTTVLHLAVGFVVAADHVAADRVDARIALNLIGAASMTGGIAATLLINGRDWRSPWLLFGPLLLVVGLWWTVL